MQIRAARALLDIKARDLADMCGLGWATIQRMESVDGVPPGLGQNIQKVQEALEAAGIIFIGKDEVAGVGLRVRK